MSRSTRHLTVNLHAMPCTNRCRHCWAEGTPRHGRMPFDRIDFVLGKLAEVETPGPPPAVLFFDEPTNHPRFVEILERAAALGFLGEHSFLATNGSILARAADDVWRRVRAAGVGMFQLTAYGLGTTHDAFAGRAGAFAGVETTIRRAVEHGIAWCAGVVLHRWNRGEIEALHDHLRALDPEGDARIGFFLPFWQGRARGLERVSAAEYARLPERLRRSPVFVSEADAVQRIRGDPALAAKRASDPVCDSLVLQVDRDLEVYCGGSCDSGGIAAAAPELRSEFRLGSLDEEGFAPLLERLEDAPPAVLRRLEEVTWGELAERHGDPEGTGMYFLHDLPAHKWAAAFLLAG